jgi:DNA-binding transcriptional MerR regulator
VEDLVSTGDLAKALGVSRGAVIRWVNSGLITPDVTTPGGHHRWDVKRVREQLRGQRKRDD